ncbi:MAG: efflux RND transporter permease subunit, partial [Betaproteobacteria bacterium]|nr:efflux RND transporter permease subunit [Betaproteobacteria bacterium]
GVDVLTSISRAETSQITARFRLDREPDGAAADVRDRVSRVRSRLPQGIDEPVVAKVDADANPVIWLSFYSDTLPPLVVSDVVSRIVKPRLQTLPGAADVRIFGERRFAMRIWLDADRLAAYKLTPSDVEEALRRQNVEVPAGRIESVQREFTVTSQTDLQREQQFLDIIVKVVNGYPVVLGDVARVKIGALNERTNVTLNAQPAVSVGLIKQATANPLVLAAALKTELPKLQQSLPTGLNVRIANDTTVFIDKSLEAVFRTILEAIALVALVILLFLGTLRASVIPLVTIPVCLVGACTLMYAAGFSINTLTLLALVLAIGLVVDDAIVVLENIYRHIEEGMKPFEAAIRGTKEVQFAVIAMTLTLAAVFTPIAFTTGRTGRLFVEFALSLAGAVLISGFVALTLTPMMCSRLLRSHAEDAQKKSLSRYVVGAIDSVVEKITSAYALMLRWALRLRWLVLILGLAVGAASAWLFTESKKELTPLEDRGTVVIIFSAPEGSSIDYTTRYGRLIGEIAEKIPEFDRRFVVSGSPTVTQGIGFLRMVDWQDRKRGTAEILKELQPKLLSIPGVLAFAVAPPSLGQSPRVRPINFVVLTSESPHQANSPAQDWR